MAPLFSPRQISLLFTSTIQRSTLLQSSRRNSVIIFLLSHLPTSSVFVTVKPSSIFAMGTKGRATPRVVCCAIPIHRSSGKVLVITSRKRADNWVLPKGGWEPSDGGLEAAALREASEEAGVRGTITRFVTTIFTDSATYHFYELDVATLDRDWLESKERRREWVDYSEAIRRIAWKPELARGLALSSLAPRR